MRDRTTLVRLHLQSRIVHSIWSESPSSFVNRPHVYHTDLPPRHYYCWRLHLVQDTGSMKSAPITAKYNIRSNTAQLMTVHDSVETRSHFIHGSSSSCDRQWQIHHSSNHERIKHRPLVILGQFDLHHWDMFLLPRELKQNPTLRRIRVVITMHPAALGMVSWQPSQSRKVEYGVTVTCVAILMHSTIQLILRESNVSAAV